MLPQILDQPCDFYLSVVGRSVVHVCRCSLLKLVLLELALSALALVGRTTQDIIHQDLKARYPTLADWQLVETYQGASLHDSTFSRAVWRLYVGAKGLVVRYIGAKPDLERMDDGAPRPHWQHRCRLDAPHHIPSVAVHTTYEKYNITKGV